jgi:hypothetical protein
MAAMRALSFIALPLLLAVACGEDTPVPDYPFPPQPPVAERPALAEYVGAEDPMDLEPVEEEEWDDGLSDEDLMLPEDGEEGTDEDEEEEEESEEDSE